MIYRAHTTCGHHGERCTCISHFILTEALWGRHIVISTGQLDTLRFKKVTQPEVELEFKPKPVQPPKTGWGPWGHGLEGRQPEWGRAAAAPVRAIKLRGRWWQSKLGLRRGITGQQPLCMRKDLLPLEHIILAGRWVVAPLGQGEGFFKVYFHFEVHDPVWNDGPTVAVWAVSLAAMKRDMDLAWGQPLWKSHRWLHCGHPIPFQRGRWGRKNKSQLPVPETCLLEGE